MSRWGSSADRSADAGYDVVGCSTCSNLWILDTDHRRSGESAECPCCGVQTDTSKLKPLAHHDTREGAAELRARRLAARAGGDDVYQDVLDEFGPYGSQTAEIESQIEAAAPISADKMDLRPIGADRYETLAKTVLEPDRRKFEEWADEYSGLYVDAFEDEVSLEIPANEYHKTLVDESLEGWADRPDRDELPRGEVTLTETMPVNAAATIELDDVTVTDVWDRLFESADLREALAASVVELFGETDIESCYDALEEYGVPFWLRSPIADATKGMSSAAWNLVADLVPPLPESPLSGVEDLLAVAGLFDGLEYEPTVAVVVREAFLDPDQTRRDQRTDVCDLLAVLASSLDVRLVGSGIDLRKVGDQHRSDLPGVSEWCNRHRGDGQIDQRVSRARDALDPDGRPVAVLRQLAAEPDGVASRHALEAMHDVSTHRISQILRTDDDSLTDLGLVDVYGPDGDQMIDVLEAGRRVVERFDAETGRQQSISSFVSDAGNEHTQCRVTPRVGLGGGDADEGATATDRRYRTRFAGRATHAAAAGCGEPGTVTVVNGAIDGENGDDGKVRLVSYDDSRDEAVVAIRAAEPLPYITTLALTLADRKLLDTALSDSSIDAIDETPGTLRGERHIGGLEAGILDDPERLRTGLVEWGETIEELTHDLHDGEYEDRTEFRSAIMCSAHGLAGSITHLLKAAGTDVARELRVPKGADRGDLAALAKSISISAAIQSEYQSFAPYRHLFDVPNSDEPTLSPQVDAADPTGSLIGSFVIRGPDVHRFRDDLERYLELPRDLLDDAPEFSIDLEVRDPNRSDYQAVASRILWRKSIRSTPTAVSVLHALVATPHDMARVLHRRLESEHRTRDVRPDELRTALRGLEPGALLADLPRSAGALLAALLDADESLSQSELADRADVSSRTVRTYAGKLDALGILDQTAGGYRLALSYPTRSERHHPVSPDLAADGSLLLDAVAELLTSTLPTDRYVDPDDPVGGVLFWPPDPWSLLEIDDYGPWVRLGGKLTGSKRPETGDRRVLMGPEISQQALAVGRKQKSTAAAD